MELIIVMGIVVLLFGGAKIPQLMRGVGEGLRELRHATREGDEAELPLSQTVAQVRPDVEPSVAKKGSL